jgi:hypothetical protein
VKEIFVYVTKEAMWDMIGMTLIEEKKRGGRGKFVGLCIRLGSLKDRAESGEEKGNRVAKGFHDVDILYSVSISFFLTSFCAKLPFSPSNIYISLLSLYDK